MGLQPISVFVIGRGIEVKDLHGDGIARDKLKVQTAFGQGADRCRQTYGKRTPKNLAQIPQTCPLRPMRPQSRNSFATSRHWLVMGTVLQNGLPTTTVAARAGP